MHAQRGGWRGIGSIGCWLVAGLLALGGLIVLLSPTSWPNDRVAGGLTVLASGLLLPPVLDRLRRRVPSARPPWVPVVIAVFILPAAAIIGGSFKPTGQAKARLRAFTVAYARQEIASGKISQAQHQLDRFADDHDPAVENLLAEVRASQMKHDQLASTPPRSPAPATAVKLQNPAAAYAERVETYWLPQARSLPDVPSDDDPTSGKLLTQLDELVIDAADGNDFRLSTSQRASRFKLLAVLSDKQVRLFPAMRQQYVKALDAKLFRDDVRVSLRGTTLTLVGGLFVRNSNVEDMQTELAIVINRLRFSRVAYRWSPYLQDGLHYDLDPPTDRTIARWDGSAFVAVKR